MMRYKIGKAFQAFGLFVVLVGLSMSMGDFTSGLDSMWAELIGLLGGMALFAVGFFLVGGAGGGE